MTKIFIAGTQSHGIPVFYSGFEFVRDLGFKTEDGDAGRLLPETEKKQEAYFHKKTGFFKNKKLLMALFQFVQPSLEFR